MYCTKENIENYLMKEIDASFDTVIENWISAAELFINSYTGKKDGFEVSASETRYFDGNGKREIDIDEFVSITSLDIMELDGADSEYSLTEGIASDYVTFPYNETPKYRLKLVNSSQVGAFYSGKRRLKVVGVFGSSSTVPKDIELAATMLVAEIVRIGSDGGKIVSETLGDYSVSFDSEVNEGTLNSVKNILNQYKILTL